MGALLRVLVPVTGVGVLLVVVGTIGCALSVSRALRVPPTEAVRAGGQVGRGA